MSCLTDEQIASLAIGETGDDEHVAGCPACAQRLAELLAQMKRLEATLAHDAGRERLLAALAREPAPTSLFWRIVMNRRNWVATAAAAAIVVAGFFGWPAGPSALAEALRAFKEAKSFACDMVALKDGKPVDESLPADKRGKFKIRLTWAAPGSLRVDTVLDGKPRSGAVLPHGADGVMIEHAAKQYTPIPREKMGKQEAAVLQVINSLAAYDPKETKSAGTDEVGEVKAPRFELKIADPEKREWRYKVWVHPTTKRALRVDAALAAGQDPAAKGVNAVRLENFEWDVKTAGVFDTKPPEGYKLVAVKADEALEKTTKLVIAALRAYREAAGGYPKDEPFNGGKAIGELEKLSKKKMGTDTLQGFVAISVLQAVSQGKYHGKSVGPEDNEKVLLRWKLDDGRFRVIYGDLKAETVSAEKLKELEGK
jgi:hypothetical protein